MDSRRIVEATVLGAFLCAGLVALGFLISDGVVKIKGLDRTVTVKGLSEREVPANIAIWPIKFAIADNDLAALYSALQEKTGIVIEFLKKSGFTDDDISVSPPAITDRQAAGYVDSRKIEFRYTANSTISVYSDRVDAVRAAMKNLVELGKQGIVIAGQDYEAKTEFLFTNLNEIKPAMIEEATKNARQVAEKFAKDSNSKLGKIKKARQGHQ